MQQPLAYRMRPQTLDDIRGQEHIIGKDKLLYRLIKADKLSSVILYGPPGTGKTSIANVIANETKLPFESINATTASKKDMQTITAKNTRTILFIDEIHRFNKAQQDYLLPFVESGQIILIGATTENPYFSVNPAIISRSTVFELKPVDITSMKNIISHAYHLMSLEGYDTVLYGDAIRLIAEYANGDVRAAINAVELSVLTTPPDSKNQIHITKEVAAECLQKPVLKYDADGDGHYNTVSAFIKSIRGSDPQAALYYLGLMLNSGEDPVFIARRLIISASEDIGLADSNALNIAASALIAAKNIGMPEARITLSHAVIYLATAPKSNSAYKSIECVYNFIKTHKTGVIPPHLKDAHYNSASKLGNGIDYKYPHDYPNNYVPQEYMPYEYANAKFYTPGNNPKEQTIKQYLDYLEYLNTKNN